MAWFMASDLTSRYAVLRSDHPCAASMPLSYLVSSEQPTDRVRFLGVDTNPVVFDVDLTEAIPAQSLPGWRVFALLYHNAGPESYYTIDGAMSRSGILSPSYTKGPVDMWSSPSSGYRGSNLHTILFEPSPIPETYLRVSIHNSSPRRQSDTPSGWLPVNYLDIGILRVEMGICSFDSSSPARLVNIRSGSHTNAIREEPQLIMSEGGPSFAREGPKLRSRGCNIVFHGPTAEEDYYSNMERFNLYCGSSRPVLLCRETRSPNIMWQTVYGRMVSVSDVSVPHRFRYESVLRIDEMV